MKYITELAGGKAAVGAVTTEDAYSSPVFEADEIFNSKEEAEDKLSEINEPYRLYQQEAYLVKPKFAVDLCIKADNARKMRDDNGKKAGIKIEYHSFYENTLYLQTYGKCDIHENNADPTSIEARQFWAYKNYLDGIADAAYELGFVLCYDTEAKCHCLRGLETEPVITFPTV